MRYTLNNFYQSSEWTSFRLSVMNDRLNEEGLIICEYCKKPIVKAYDCIAHHKEHLTEGNINNAMIAFNPDNIMLVHLSCHNRIHNKLCGSNSTYTHKQIYLVYGSPLSGKTTYVNNAKIDGDLIVDIDSIWQCVSGCNKYIKPAQLKSVVFGVRDTLLEMVRMRRGKWNNAYVIGGYPLSGERERLLNSLGAREIFVDTSREECIDRLLCCNDGRNKAEWAKYIDEWWRKFSKHPPP